MGEKKVPAIRAADAPPGQRAGDRPGQRRRHYWRKARACRSGRRLPAMPVPSSRLVPKICRRLGPRTLNFLTCANPRHKAEDRETGAMRFDERKDALTALLGAVAVEEPHVALEVVRKRACVRRPWQARVHRRPMRGPASKSSLDASCSLLSSPRRSPCQVLGPSLIHAANMRVGRLVFQSNVG